eukprot:469784_1
MFVSQWRQCSRVNVMYCVSLCHQYNYCQSETQLKKTINTDELTHRNDYKKNSETKHRNQRINKYETSYRKTGYKQIIGTQNVRKKLPSHLIGLYSQIMHELHQRNWQNAINKLHSSIEKDEQCKNIILYTVCIRACCVSGKLNEAKQLYDEMYDIYQIKPDEITLIAMLKGCSIIRDWNRSQFWFKKILNDGNMFENELPNKIAAYVLMISSANEFTWKDAWYLFNKVKINKDIIMYNAMLDVLARSKESILCQELFIEIQNDNLLAEKIDKYTFNSVIRSCVYDGNIRIALNYMNLMQSEFNIKMTKQIISDVLRTIKYYNDKDSNGFELGKTLWEQVIGIKMIPDAILFGIMIDLCCKYNDFTYGLKLFNDMITIYEIKPTNIVFNNLLKCCVINCKQDKDYLFRLLNDMKNVYNLIPDQYTYNIILNSIIKYIIKQLNDIYNLNEKSFEDKYFIVTQLLIFW